MKKNTKMIDPSTKLVAFAGRKRSGKTMFAQMLKFEKKAVVITIADFLKKLCCELTEMTYDELITKKDDGSTFDFISNDRWYDIINASTNIPIDDIKRELEGRHITTIRELLQVVGTDVIRKYDEDWHVRKMVEAIEEASEENEVIAVDDVRFPNEKKALEKLGGNVFFIIRPNNMEVSNHPSETALRWQDFDPKNVIINDINKYEVLFQFDAHYETNYRLNTHILLSERPAYLNSPLAKEYEYDIDKDKFIADLLQQNRDNKSFIKNGLIQYKTCFKEFAREFEERLLGKKPEDINERFGEFMVYNPLITENLKAYL